MVQRRLSKNQDFPFVLFTQETDNPAWDIFHQSLVLLPFEQLCLILSTKCYQAVKNANQNSFTRVRCSLILENNNTEYFKRGTASVVILLNGGIEGKLTHYSWQTGFHSVFDLVLGASTDESIWAWDTVEWRTDWVACIIYQLQCYFWSVYCTGSCLITSGEVQPGTNTEKMFDIMSKPKKM